MSEKSKKVYVKGHTPFKYYRDFSISTALITLAILAPSLAFIGAYKPENHELNIWFQRSGSLAVLLSLTAEYVISHYTILCALQGLLVLILNKSG